MRILYKLEHRPLSGLWPVLSRMGVHWLRGDLRLLIISLPIGVVTLALLGLVLGYRDFIGLANVTAMFLECFYLLIRLIDAFIPRMTLDQRAELDAKVNLQPWRAVKLFSPILVFLLLAAASSAAATIAVPFVGLDWAFAPLACLVGLLVTAALLVLVALLLWVARHEGESRSSVHTTANVSAFTLRVDSERWRAKLDGGYCHQP